MGFGVGKGMGRRLVALAAAATAAGQLSHGPAGLAAPRDGFGTAPAATSVRAPAGDQQGSMVLRVRRLDGAVELVLQGTGPSPKLVQSSSSGAWQGRLTTVAPQALRLGTQRLSLPEIGLEQIIFSGSGTSFQLDVVPSQGLPLARPVVSADGQNLIVTFSAVPQASLQTARPNLNQPGVVPQSTYAPPLRPRAVAPPVGDMSVGTMVLANRSFVRVFGPRVTLNLRNASAIDSLMALARQASYGFVYIDIDAIPLSRQGSAGAAANSAASAATTINQSGSSASVNSDGGASASTKASIAYKNEGVPVTLSLINEEFGRAFNSILIAANLQARLEGRTIFVGPKVMAKTFGYALSKVYRLNQVSPGSAADYLANLGASVTKANTVSTAVSTGTSQANSVVGSPSSSTTTNSSTTTVESYGAASGPLLGLQATTDSRLGTITLVGDAALVSVAEQYLRQLDLRQRQVALSVKILDVNLGNDSRIANSFAFRSGNSFILSEDGRLTATFGSLTPNGLPNPGLTRPDGALLDQLSAVILSDSTKVLASPTLILSENSEPNAGSSSAAPAATAASGTRRGGVASVASIGRAMANEGAVTVGEDVVVGYDANTTQTTVTCTPQFENAGLSFGARISKIDDNGYVAFSMTPEITAELPGDVVPNCGPFSKLARRRLETGVLRVRDGQTLVLTGVISEDILSSVQKWPVLGDLPLIGQFFRRTRTGRGKNELIIIVTPKILRDDDSVDPFGYGFRPSTQDGRQFMSDT